MTKLFSLAMLALSAALISNVTTAENNEPDDGYIDVHFQFNQWAAAKTAATPHILICDGVFRYWPAL